MGGAAKVLFKWNMFFMDVSTFSHGLNEKWISGTYLKYYKT
jgi:hypothetical protein